MILGIGVDLCRIPRIRRSVERLGEAWIEELFAIEEHDRCAASVDSGLAFARGFACKEACAKALGTGLTLGVDPRDIALWEADGGLTLRLDGGALARLQQISPPNCGVHCLVTCKHVDDFMSCVVVLEATPDPNPGVFGEPEPGCDLTGCFEADAADVAGEPVRLLRDGHDRLSAVGL